MFSLERCVKVTRFDSAPLLTCDLGLEHRSLLKRFTLQRDERRRVYAGFGVLRQKKTMKTPESREGKKKIV